MENQLRTVLTEVCEAALKEIEGFQWLTHFVNYSKFPGSLKVVCIFDTNANLASYMLMIDEGKLNVLVQEKLFAIGVNLKDIKRHLVFDTEEDCDKYHDGKWIDRLQ